MKRLLLHAVPRADTLMIRICTIVSALGMILFSVNSHAQAYKMSTDSSEINLVKEGPTYGVAYYGPASEVTYYAFDVRNMLSQLSCVPTTSQILSAEGHNAYYSHSVDYKGILRSNQKIAFEIKGCPVADGDKSARFNYLMYVNPYNKRAKVSMTLVYPDGTRINVPQSTMSIGKGQSVMLQSGAYSYLVKAGYYRIEITTSSDINIAGLYFTLVGEGGGVPLISDYYRYNHPL